MRDDKLGELLGNLMVGLVLFVAGLVATFLRGWTLLWLWHWFVVPLGVSPLSFWAALGISTIVAFLTFELNSETSEEGPVFDYGVAIAKSAGMSLIAFSSGFIYQLFI